MLKILSRSKGIKRDHPYLGGHKDKEQQILYFEPKHQTLKSSTHFSGWFCGNQALRKKGLDGLFRWNEKKHMSTKCSMKFPSGDIYYLGSIGNLISGDEKRVKFATEIMKGWGSDFVTWLLMKSLNYLERKKEKTSDKQMILQKAL
ncbi:unnamed protein product [Lactuca saligna]|uniref:Uncharacterized protein n=1 Tax=Lactuca saligna TaxID=75948 RepID=A0AA35YDW2_LACSI|nr:unnamed protein product [Lactuca saligna]